MSYANDRTLRAIEECGRSLRDYFVQEEKKVQDLITENEKLKTENEALRAKIFLGVEKH